MITNNVTFKGYVRHNFDGQTNRLNNVNMLKREPYVAQTMANISAFVSTKAPDVGLVFDYDEKTGMVACNYEQKQPEEGNMLVNKRSTRLPLKEFMTYGIGLVSLLINADKKEVELPKE